MTLLLYPAGTTTVTAAAKLATANFTANLAALTGRQPNLIDELRELHVERNWTFGRDGSLTAMDADGKWWAGCSLPMLASHTVLQSLETNNQVSCFLAPVHAALLVAARERMGPEPALLAAVPDLLTLHVILACADFSADILSHHLWFVTGQRWADQLQSLFEAEPGLPTPARFIKTKLTADDIIEPMIAEAQKVIGGTLAARAQSIEAIRSTWSGRKKCDRVLLIAGSRFRLWDDGQELLKTITASVPNIHSFDCDDPASASPIALAATAQNCRAIVTANISRADAPNLAPPDTRWITWLTRPLVPAFNPASPMDALILADFNWKSVAISAGWPVDRLLVAGWPAQRLPLPEDSKSSLAIIADTRSIEIPRAIEDLSSHRILWEYIESELAQVPFALSKLDPYLDDRCLRFSIKPDAIDRRTFIDNLILPVYQQGLAKAILNAGLPLKLHGAGWKDLADFAPHALGPVLTRQALINAATSATVLVYAWPVRHVHQIESFGRPVLTPSGHRPEPFLQQAGTALRGGFSAQRPATDNLTSTVLSLLNSQ